MASRSVPHISSHQAHSRLSRLTISGYRGASGIGTVHQFVQCLCALLHLRHLKLVDVAFRNGDEPAGFGVLQKGLNTLELEDVSAETLRGLFSLFLSTVEHITFTGCMIPDEMDRLPPCGLQIAHLSAEQDLAPVLRRWSGEDLTVIDCPSFNTALLAELAQPDAVGNWMCPRLMNITVSGCAQFTSGDLRRMVDPRCAVRERTGFPDPGDDEFIVSSIDMLKTSDCGALEPEDREWFDKNICTVEWNSWSGGTKQSVLYR
ncbi:hypothetical protein SCP_0102140 [Sparassis crispa]|uniref:F-box domain-containing protein n=1 Tax=Sparassis crispa TaxID=139825 RepID=A0A401G5A2_9APHY|nr:hypothetical protein SCP_0102140 [Sparassis crispa]GBE77341.1 hypothetical protein SCP_0102140 [Sparassis crispa]